MYPAYVIISRCENILLGPTLPAFVSENVWKILVENYNIQKISTVEEDMKKILG